MRAVVAKLRVLSWLQRKRADGQPVMKPTKTKTPSSFNWTGLAASVMPMPSGFAKSRDESSASALEASDCFQ